ncbi:MAG: acyl-CoA dehydrogenase family protein, partial [Deltaproteobacteria bacterium]|nr:acyl-CoA dehydrogenase family protein [Deltaproteobacteria bacterium]
MDFQLTDEQISLKKKVRDLAVKQIAPMVENWEKEGLMNDQEMMPAYKNLGLLGMTLPKEYGGGGRSVFDAILVIEELARLSTIASMPVFETSVGPIRVVEKFGTEEQKKRFIPPCCTGEKLMAVAMTEPEAGSALTD